MGFALVIPVGVNPRKADLRCAKSNQKKQHQQDNQILSENPIQFRSG